ncbi:MAG: CXXX repeat peptide modification system protein [Halanaerobiales bacterium]|nr:CXXX repeat peptide modification system protein [Halanaerobiales bacterium]
MSCGCEKKLEKVGQVTSEERDEIQRLYNRKMSLKELVMVLQENSAQNSQVDDAMYEKVVQDISDTNQNFQGWWDLMAQKYHWKNIHGGHWRIDFNTCDIFLEYPTEC